MHWALFTAPAVAPMHPTSALRTVIAGSPTPGARAQRNLCPTGAASRGCRPAEPACDGAQPPSVGWGGGRGLHWTHGPGCTSDTCGLPRWTESLLLPWAKLGSSLNQPLDLICGNCSLAWHSRQRRHQSLHDLRGWVLGSPPINRVPTSPKAPDLHWCQRGGTGRTQKKGGDLPSACQGPRGNKVRPLKGGTCQSLVRGHAKSPGVGGLACREFHICSLYQNSKKVGLDLGEGSGIRASAEMEPKWVLGVKGELWAG